MSSVTLSAATRQNLLSLQDTANLLSTTQNRLSTGKKVNSALDNPVNFFTSQALDSRSSALTSLLDGVSNGIQTIQAANQGITSIQKLTDQLKSTAQQALASSNAFTAKASVSSATTITVDPATQSILGGTLTAATATGATAYASAGLGTGTAATASTSTGTVAVADNTALQALSGPITVTDGAGNTATYTIDGTSTKTALTTALSTNGFSASFDGSNHLVITRADGANFTTSGSGATATGNGAGTGGAAGTPGDAFTLNVGGTSVTLNAAASGSAAGTFTNLATLVSAINSSSVGSATAGTAGKVTASVGTGANAGKLVITSGDTATSFTASGAAATKLGVPTGAQAATTTGGLSGQTLTVSVAGAPATTITFGGNGVKTLNDLNNQLAAANAQATIGSNGVLSITTTNEAGAESIQLGGTATGVGQLFTDTTSHTATLGGDGKTLRDKLANDYNNLRTQIDQLAKDAGYNGVNLLNGDTLKIAFNETNTSSLSVKGTSLGSDTLGISAVGSADFQDANSINKILGQLTSATSLLNSQSSTYGSNLSVVQNRQDFTKNIINVLDTGSANLTNADMNAEAANSTALSTRNSLGISALSLANQAQQGILQLLR